MGKGNKVTIGDRIRRIRKKRRLTQAELAMMSGLSLSAIQGYEQGRYEPKRKSLESIAEVFKIPVDELYDMPTQHGTNLAEVGTDCISRRSAIDALRAMQTYKLFAGDDMLLIDQAGAQTELMLLPPIQSEIIRCRECKFASGDSRICMKFDHSPIGELDFCSFAERREVNNESN